MYKEEDMKPWLMLVNYSADLIYFWSIRKRFPKLGISNVIFVIVSFWVVQALLSPKTIVGLALCFYSSPSYLKAATLLQPLHKSEKQWRRLHLEFGQHVEAGSLPLCFWTITNILLKHSIRFKDIYRL